MHPVESYLAKLNEIHASGHATDETSYYPAIEGLLSEIGNRLKPRVRPILQLRNRGAGLPDGGLFTQDQLKKNAQPEDFTVQPPNRGVMEVKGLSEDISKTVQSDQIKKYLRAYGQVLVTNYREFRVVVLGKDDKPRTLETFTLAKSEAAFWALAAHPRKAEGEVGKTLEEFLNATSTPCASGADDNLLLTSMIPTANNQVSNFLYDAAGDVINDGNNSYAYDAEERLCAVAYPDGTGGALYEQYLYDAEGRRVGKLAATSLSCAAPSSAPTTQYLLGLGGEQVTELSISGTTATPRHSNIFAGGKLLATYDFIGAMGLHFALTDPLGTRRVQVSGTSEAELNCLSLPFGNSLGNSRASDCIALDNEAADATEQHFTGKERDTESGNDYFGARYYASSMGRFLSPDWSAKVEPVPYSKLDNPQTLNLYAYVGNNPLSRVDPTGHADIAAECKGQSTCEKTLVQSVNIVHQDKKGNTIVDSTLKVTTNFKLTTDAKGNVSASASSTVANVSGLKFSGSQLATMGKDIGTMQQAAVGMGFGQNTTELVTAVGASESHFGASPSYAGAPAYMNPAINPMQLIGKNGPNMDLNHNVEGGMGVLDWAGRPSDFNPGSAPGDTYYRYSDHSPTTMSNWNAIYGSITEQQP